MREKEKVLDQLKTQRAALEGPEVDPKQVLQEWASELTRLLKSFREWLRDAEEQGLLEIQDDIVHLEEQHIGEYTAPALRIASSRVAIRIVPRARYVLGALGRVDFETPSDRVILLRTQAGSWKFARFGRHKWATTTLTEERFWKVLSELLQ